MSTPNPWLTCACGKRGYASRASAKRIARLGHRGEGMNAYRCLVNESFWHLGHLSADVRQGQKDRSIYKQGRPA